MKLEQQCCSLDLSKRLKKLGVKQESYFMWEGIMADVNKMRYTVKRSRDNHNPERFAAFTVAELGEILPDELCDKHEDLPYYLTCEKRSDPDYWIVFYNETDRGILGGKNGPLHIETSTEADARAKLLVYLLENNLITL